MFNIKFILFTYLFVVSTAFADGFESKLSIQLGLMSESLSDFSYQNVNVDADGAGMFFNHTWGIDYQYSKNWSLQFGVTDIENGQGDSLITGADQLLRVKFRADLYRLENIYRTYLNQNISFQGKVGVLIAKEKIALQQCNNSDLNFLFCRDDYRLINVSNDMKVSALLGVAVEYKLSESWTTSAFYNYANYRNGYSEKGLLLSYKF
ncbi:MAG: outer membrane beta-barrel protein [Gammaproteobacteria bacterium]|nr:outer membrane beta-barrel protein [Gammaproteobacteria bacterium]